VHCHDAIRIQSLLSLCIHLAIPPLLLTGKPRSFSIRLLLDRQRFPTCTLLSTDRFMLTIYLRASLNGSSSD
jgi:hypothetical protein